MNLDLQKYYLRILGKRDYSEQILIDKALQKNYSTLDIQESIIWLKDKNFLNETRLAENLVNFFKAKKGKNWIKFKLRTKKIKEEIIDNITNKINFEAGENLKVKIQKKYKIETFNDLEKETKYKILGFLQRQGYTNSSEILAKWVEKDQKNK
jgi:SOS response regulatory protein OraA/RecX